MKARGYEADWKVIKYGCSTQEDGNSCGVFVLMNAEALLKDVPPVVMRQFHCETYRQYILGRLLYHAKSNDAEIICDFPFCEKPSGEKIQWTQCDNCSRWMHNCCVGLPIDDVGKMESDDKSFKCGFCVT